MIRAPSTVASTNYHSFGDNSFLLPVKGASEHLVSTSETQAGGRMSCGLE